MTRKDRHNNSQDWRGAPLHQPHNRRSTDRTTLSKVAKWVLVIMALATLYGTLKPECRSFQSSTSKACVD